MLKRVRKKERGERRVHFGVDFVLRREKDSENSVDKGTILIDIAACHDFYVY